MSVRRLVDGEIARYFGAGPAEPDEFDLARERRDIRDLEDGASVAFRQRIEPAAECLARVAWMSAAYWIAAMTRRDDPAHCARELEQLPLDRLTLADMPFVVGALLDISEAS